VVRQHLAECGRCRAAVTARAGGVPGPGETVVLKQPARVAPLPIPIKLAVAMSLVVVVGAWRYAGTSTPSLRDLCRAAQVGDLVTPVDQRACHRGHATALQHGRVRRAEARHRQRHSAARTPHFAPWGAELPRPWWGRRLPEVGRIEGEAGVTS
jgi:hypothetical protein